MNGPRLEDFSSTLGESWEAHAANGAVPLRLDVAEPLAGAVRADGGFRLEWVGPAEPFLPQGIYRFVRDGGVWDMFIVPIARSAERGARYEAIFN